MRMSTTTTHRRTKAIVYADGNIGITRFGSMQEAIDVVKQLVDQKQVKGIAVFSGTKYQETIPIGGLV